MFSRLRALGLGLSFSKGAEYPYRVRDVVMALIGRRGSATGSCCPKKKKDQVFHGDPLSHLVFKLGFPKGRYMSVQHG